MGLIDCICKNAENNLSKATTIFSDKYLSCVEPVEYARVASGASLFSFFASHSFSTVTLPTSAVKRSFCSCDLTSSSLYSLTALEGSIAISALASITPQQIKTTI